MGNVAIHEKGKTRIVCFLIDAVKVVHSPENVNDYYGTNGKQTGVDMNLFDELWTDDITDVVIEDNAGPIYDKSVDQLTPGAENAAIAKTPRGEFRQAVKLQDFIAGLAYDQLDTYIESNINSLADAKAYLKKLSKVVLATVKRQNGGK